ncbi:cell wall hydrolase [Roseomonas populi]|uniref:Cell wall hydrolase n=1 Tax=Roseomonas populi TaxID=3121582 RepID=A0ABT1X9J6_9PROT|nr:cell wall hydrolase [Roseomonas pecuniae]MCR0984779.1 cell wall hydrolase [Roseomonas pecuniae]
MDATETLARTLYAEAGRRPVRAIEALAALAVNRARNAMPRPARTPGAAPFARGGHARLPEPGPREVEAVCRDPFLFPSHKPRHPNHALLEAPHGDPAFAMCRRIAVRAVCGTLADPTGGATHWHPAEALPGWAMAQVPVEEIGGLLFYRLETGARPAAPAAPALVAV